MMLTRCNYVYNANKIVDHIKNTIKVGDTARDKYKVLRVFDNFILTEVIRNGQKECFQFYEWYLLRKTNEDIGFNYNIGVERWGEMA